MDTNNVAVLLLLDLSAAFDTTNHEILIDRLEKWVGLSDRVLAWFLSYLTGAKVFCQPGCLCITDSWYKIWYSSRKHSRPSFVYIYMLPIANIINHHHVNYHFYANDTQLYISIAK